MEFRDLPPRKDVKGGSPKTPSRIPLSEFEEQGAVSATTSVLGHNGMFWGVVAKAVTWVLQLAVLAAVFWVKANFVTKEEYAADSKESLKSLNSINISMQRVADKLEGYERISKKQDEHDAELLALHREIWEIKKTSRP